MAGEEEVVVEEWRSGGDGGGGSYFLFQVYMDIAGTDCQHIRVPPIPYKTYSHSYGMGEVFSTNLGMCVAESALADWLLWNMCGESNISSLCLEAKEFTTPSASTRTSNLKISR